MSNQRLHTGGQLIRMNLPQPNEVIKNRIILEAKRLLVHTVMTAKEIAYELGYEDPAYFSRLFFIKTGESPSGFKSKYLGKSNAEVVQKEKSA